MKKNLALILIAVIHCKIVFAGWLQNIPMPSDPRVIANTFVIGTNAYICGGFNSNYIYKNDLWEYNSITSTWTQKANLPVNAGGSSAFNLNNKGYVVNGWVNGFNSNGVYEYDNITNMWSTKNNFPGAPRYGSCVFTLNNKAYVGLGYTPFQNDLWQYDPINDAWTQKANFIGGGRSATVHFTLNGLGYVGCGLNDISTYAGLNDFYTYNDLSNTWTQIGNFPGPARHSALSFVINNQAYVTTGNSGNATGTTYGDLWKFNPVSAIWTQLPSLPDTVRQSGSAFAIGNCGYIFGGFHQPSTTFFNQLWQYCEVTGIDETSIANIQFTVSPNPAKEFTVCSLQFTDNKKINISVTDVNGRKLISEQLETVNSKLETKINVSTFPSGVYLITVECGNKKTVKKFIKN